MWSGFMGVCSVSVWAADWSDMDKWHDTSAPQHHGKLDCCCLLEFTSTELDLRCLKLCGRIVLLHNVPQTLKHTKWWLLRLSRSQPGWSFSSLAHLKLGFCSIFGKLSNVLEMEFKSLYTSTVLNSCNHLEFSRIQDSFSKFTVHLCPTLYSNLKIYHTLLLATENRV